MFIEDDVEVNSIGDIASVLNDKYRTALDERREFKKGEKSEIFLDFLKDLFEKCGSVFGYSSLSKFKSDVIICKNTIKKSKNMFAGRNFEKHFETSPRIEIDPIFEISLDSWGHHNG